MLYFILINRPTGKWFISAWSIVVTFVWVIVILLAYFLSIVLVCTFLIEQAQGHLWIKIVIIIFIVASVVGSIVEIYWLMTFARLNKILALRQE